VLTLSQEHLRATLQVDLGYARWFDGLALFPGAFSDFGDVVLDHVLDHASVSVESE